MDRVVTFELRDGRRVWVRPREARDRVALLRATRTSAEQRACTLRLQGRLGARLVGAAHFLFASGLLTALWLLAAKHRVLVRLDLTWAAQLGLLIAATLGAAMSRVYAPRIVIGTEGLRIRRSFRERFVPFDEIIAFEAEQTGAPGHPPEGTAMTIGDRDLREPAETARAAAPQTPADRLCEPRARGRRDPDAVGRETYVARYECTNPPGGHECPTVSGRHDSCWTVAPILVVTLRPSGLTLRGLAAGPAESVLGKRIL